MSAHHEEPPIPATPNVNLELGTNDPAFIDPKFTGNYSPSGPLYTTQKQAYQKPGKKGDPSSYGWLGDAYVQHNYTTLPNFGPEASLVPEASLAPEVVSVDDRARAVASYALWVVNSHEPSKGRLKRLIDRRPKLLEDVSVSRLAEALKTVPEESQQKFIKKLLKVGTDHNTVATINAHKSVAPLSKPGDSVVPKEVQELGQIVSDKGIYSKARRKARANQRKILEAVSHSYGSTIAQSAHSQDPRLKSSKEVLRDAKIKRNDTHHVHEFLGHVAPAINRRLAFKHTPKLAKEINTLIKKMNSGEESQQQAYARNAQEIGLQDGEFRVNVDGKVETGWHIFDAKVKPDPKKNGARTDFFELEGPKGERIVVSIDKLLDWQF